MDTSEPSVPSRQLLIDGSPDDCKFCDSKLNPANLGLDFKTGAVAFVRCDKCKEIPASGEIKKEMSPAEPVVQQQISREKKTKKLPISFQCLHCPMSFSLKFHRRKHVMAVHISTTFDRKDLLKRLCKLCGREFQRKESLIAHIHVNHRVQEVKCSNGSFEETKGATHARIQKGGKLFVCPYCLRKCACNANLIIHIRTHTGERPFGCKDCDKKFFSKGNLASHMRTHTGERPYECKDCGKKFVTKSDLNVHARTHTGERPYECKDCGKKFSTKSYLNRHARTHTGKGPFELKDCDKKFAIKSNLDVHARIHMSQRPFKCKHCYKKYCRKGKFAAHMRSHEKQLTCTQCGKKFDHISYDLTNHNISIHMKPLCNRCGQKFGSQFDLTHNIRTHTAEKL